VDVDVDTAYRVQAAALHSKVKWTPFANQQLFGRIERVVLRGTTVFADGELLADEGSGTVIFSHLMNKSGLTQNAD
jgi:carbamoyl-phosphate synthase/aspartate carbamoyltransferase/dihydroorotase